MTFFSSLSRKSKFFTNWKNREKFLNFFMSVKIFAQQFLLSVKNTNPLARNFESVTGLDADEIETECCFLRHRFNSARAEKEKHGMSRK